MVAGTVPEAGICSPGERKIEAGWEPGAGTAAGMAAGAAGGGGVTAGIGAGCGVGVGATAGAGNAGVGVAGGEPMILGRMGAISPAGAGAGVTGSSLRKMGACASAEAPVRSSKRPESLETRLL